MKIWLKYGLRGVGIIVGLGIILSIIGVILNLFIDEAFFLLIFPFFIAIQFLAVNVLGGAVMWHCAGIGCNGPYYSIGRMIGSSLLLLLIIFIVGAVIGLIVKIKRRS